MQSVADNATLRPGGSTAHTASAASDQVEPVGLGERIAELHSGSVRPVPIEASFTETFSVVVGDTADRELDRERREAALVGRYVGWLAGRGTLAFRHEIRPAELGESLYTDIFDPSLAEIVEAKASTSRSDVRMALGQLLDYGRFVPHRSLAILTPEPITGELLDLLVSHGFSNIYEDEVGGFRRSR